MNTIPEATFIEALKFYWSFYWRATIILLIVLGPLTYFFLFTAQMFSAPNIISPDKTYEIMVMTMIITYIALCCLIVFYTTYKVTRRVIRICKYKTFMFRENIQNNIIFRYVIYIYLLGFIVSLELQVFGLAGNYFAELVCPVLAIIIYNKTIMSREFLGIYLPIVRIEAPTTIEAEGQ